MPAYPDTSNPISRASSSQTFRSAGGDQTTLSIPVSAAATAVQIEAMQQTIATVSNAGEFKRKFVTGSQIPIAEVISYDEAHSSVATRLVLVFQNGNLDSVHVAIPAPDQPYFGGDGVSFNSAYAGDVDHPSATALLTAITTALNAGATGGDVYTFVRGYRSNYAQRLRRPVTGEVAVEPIADNPPG